MTDVHPSHIRSYNMSRIKSKDTKPELLIRSYLHSKGLRYKLHDKKLPGKPDLVFPRYRTVLFVHGCFWHMHENCKFASIPKTKTEWWIAKLSKNVERDEKNVKELTERGWNVLIHWECEKSSEDLEKTYKRILKNEPRVES